MFHTAAVLPNALRDIATALLQNNVCLYSRLKHFCINMDDIWLRMVPFRYSSENEKAVERFRGSKEGIPMAVGP